MHYNRLHAGALIVAAAFGTMSAVPAAIAQCSAVEFQDPQSTDAFGSGVAIWEDAAVVSSPLHEVEGVDSGAAFVYRCDSTTGGWNLEAMLLADDRASRDSFGSASIWGETIVVGAPGDDDLGPESGSAYVFRRASGVWVQEQKLLADDGEAGERFGGAHVWGDVIAVGVFRDGNSLGSVYVFRHDGSGWVQEQKITPHDGREDDWFGSAIALEGDHLLVGALRHDGFAGAAYLYTFDAVGSRWEFTQKLLAPHPEPSDFFGSAVALGGERLLIGAMWDDDGGVGAGGAAYVYQYDRNAGEWALEEKLLPSGRYEESQYGVSVAISGEFALIGTSSHGGETGPPALFRRGALGWEEIGELRDIFPPYDWNMGVPVRMSGGRAIVGSRGWTDLGDPQPGVATVFNLNACECRADFDGSGSVTTRDVVVFLNAWATGHAGADFSGDSRLDTRDVVVFLNAWVVGC